MLSLRPRVAGWTQAVTERLAEIETPALLLVGDRSRASTPFQAEYMAGQLRDARIETLPGAGDGLYLLHADWCVARTREFLAGLPRI